MSELVTEYKERENRGVTDDSNVSNLSDQEMGGIADFIHTHNATHTYTVSHIQRHTYHF